MSQTGSIWVGLLELDTNEPVTGMAGAVLERHKEARVLVRVHKAPLGYVVVPAHPEETLTERIRDAAKTTLAVPLRRHLDLDKSSKALKKESDWAAQVNCPNNYALNATTGVTVIVCTRDRTETLRKSLSALQRIIHTPVEFLIIDNAPTGKETWQVVADFAIEDPRFRYSCEPRPGLSRARNHGVKEATYDIVAFTDDDTMADPGWPTAIAAAFAADPSTACVTGLVVPSALDTGPERYFDARYQWGEVFEARQYDLGDHRLPSPLYPFSAGIFGTGANFAIRRSTYLTLGEFDPLLGAGSPTRGGEDLDMFLRVLLGGERLAYVPSGLVWHRHRADVSALGEQIYSYGYGLGAYLAKHLLSRNLKASVLGRGLIQQSGVVISRMRQASEASQLGVQSRRLALNETFGVAAGALRYYRAARKKNESVSGT
jgi:GT2 family glycosyltransferase